MPDPRANDGPWALEVVRGANLGRRYAVPPGETIAGNALNGVPGLDLASHESGPRRMAARQARFQRRGESLAVIDLGSPGGTFVNRERLVPFQPRALSPGDVIQMAGVQLQVARGTTTGTAPAAPAPPPPPVARPTAAGFQFAMKSGMTCRSWDDFLTASAQDWAGLRDELVSGRLAAFLAGTGRAVLAPDPHAPGSPDERLDAWLASVPSSRPPSPELEAHPDRLAIAASSVGGVARRTITVTNTGYRLLRTTARVEPADASWLRLVEAASPGEPFSFTTTDRTTLTLEITLPDSPGESRTAALSLSSNGGEKRVAVTLGPRAAAEAVPFSGAPEEPPAGLELGGLRKRLAAIPPRRRLLIGAVSGLVGRGLVAVASAILPGLLGPAALGALVGVVGGAEAMRRRGAWRDMTAGAVAGGVAGVLGASVVVALCRAVESTLGISSPLPAVLVWGAIGLAVGGLTLAMAPPALRKEATV